MYGKRKYIRGSGALWMARVSVLCTGFIIVLPSTDFLCRLAGAKRPQCVPKAALRAAFSSVERRESCTVKLGGLKDLRRGHDASRLIAPVSEGRPTLKVMVANTSQGLIS